MNKGFAPIFIFFAFAISALLAAVALRTIKHTQFSIAPIVIPTATPTPTPSPTSSSQPLPTSSATSTPVIHTNNGSSTHIRTETNGVVHDITVGGNDSYEYHDANTNIVINNK